MISTVSSDRSIRRSPARAAALWLAVALTVCGSGAATVPAEEPSSKSVTAELKAAIDRARDKVFPALVSIITVREYYSQGRKRLSRSGGSGTIISDQGYIVTNAHVAQDGSRFKVILSDKREIDAKLIGEDPASDLAVIQLDLTQLEPDEQLPVAKFGDSRELDIGDYVMAMGSPWGMSRSMSLGIVNNNDRVLANFFMDDADYEVSLGADQPTGMYYRWIQHDAAIAPGNSGGPLVNLKGEIVGVNTRGTGWAGNLGLASPSSVVQDVVGDLVAFGEVIRSYVGLKFKPIKTTGHDHGVFVNAVIEDSPADRAGMKPGDFISAIDDEPVTVRYVEEMPALRRDLSDRPVGSKVKFTYERGGDKADVLIVTEKYEKDRGDRKELKKWGFTVQDLTPRMARNRRLPSHEGVLVTGVEVGRPAQTAKPPLQRGDVILAVDGLPVVELPALMKAYHEIIDQEKLPEFVRFDFERNAGRYVTILEPKDEEDDDRPAEIAKAWLGVEVQPVVKEMAKEIGIEGKKGFRVVKIYERTKAFDSDLEVGDIITHLNGAKLKVRSDEDYASFQRKIKQQDIGDQAELTLLRDGGELQISVELEPAKKTIAEAKRIKNRDFDLEVREITFFDIANRRWKPDTKGVLVTKVERGGWAGVGHLRIRDLIIRIGEDTIDGLEAFKQAMKDIADSKPEKVRMLVLRGIETRFLFIETDWDSLVVE
ncbi:MAG: PDZ domain-containing protein [Planctomycetes bacterium]|nr:PDZ domain-containing protein [Planctomycetota bacterium]